MTVYFPPGTYVITETIDVSEPPPNRPTAVGVGDPGDRWFNVKDYGATGDGVTDDTTSIKAAIAAVLGDYE